MDQGGQLLVVQASQPSGDCRAQFAAHAVSAMTKRAGVGELALSRIVVDILAGTYPYRTQSDQQRVKA
jgi:hypothetical protein